MKEEIDRKAHSLFCYGKYIEAELPTLTNQENKIYNMVRAGFPYESIAKRLSIVPHSVSARVAMIRNKGWDI